MKATQIRSAGLLINQLDMVVDDLDTIANSAELTQVVVSANGKTLKYKPDRQLYQEFLRTRRATVEGMLNKLGVTVNE